jgi:hypothetical protein
MGAAPFALVIVAMLASSCGGAKRDHVERSLPVPLSSPPSTGGALSVRESLERARLLDKAGVHEHRDALRAYQTAARLLTDGFEVYAGCVRAGQRRLHAPLIGAMLELMVLSNLPAKAIAARRCCRSGWNHWRQQSGIGAYIKAPPRCRHPLTKSSRFFCHAGQESRTLSST